MKNSLKKILGILHLSNLHLSPFSAWTVLVVVFCVVNIVQLAFVINAVFNMMYGDMRAPGVVTVPVVETIERGHLKDVIVEFQQRQTAFESFKTSFVVPNDPSR
ncbi:MAG: hypothetical protein AAB458_02775 [Patescibacteria group bacterium]